MKVLLMLISLLAIPFSVSAHPVAVGEDFGRIWINNFVAQSTKPASHDNNVSLWNWRTTPKGKALVGSNLVDAQNII